MDQSLLQERRLPVCVSRRGVADRISQKPKFLCSYTLNTCSSSKKLRRSKEGRRVPVMSYSTVKTSAKWPKITGSPVWEEGSFMMEKTFPCLVPFLSFCPAFNLRSKYEAKSPWKSHCIWHAGAYVPASIIFLILHMGAQAKCVRFNHLCTNITQALSCCVKSAVWDSAETNPSRCQLHRASPAWYGPRAEVKYHCPKYLRALCFSPPASTNLSNKPNTAWAKHLATPL